MGRAVGGLDGARICSAAATGSTPAAACCTSPVSGGPGRLTSPARRLARRYLPRSVSCPGRCMAIPRVRWDELGGFPEHFFMYCEDVDLSLRLRLMGEKLAVVPDVPSWHDLYEFAKGGRKFRLLERNRWATVIRTYPRSLLLAVLPALIAAGVAVVWVVASRRGWGRMKAARDPRRAAGSAAAPAGASTHPRSPHCARSCAYCCDVGDARFAVFRTSGAHGRASSGLAWILACCKGSAPMTSPCASAWRHGAVSFMRMKPHR